MKAYRLLIVGLFMLVTPAIAQQAKVTTFTLDNGMEAVVIEDHRAPVVTHMVWYRVGSADEAPGKSGIAHFLEHLMFVGTDDIPEGEFSRIIESLGGNDNAFTSHDYTAYFQRISTEHLELMMTMEADRMHDLILNEEAVRTERDVVLAERTQRTDSDPGSLFSEQRAAALYMNHRYGIPVIGWRHEIEQLNLTDALEFYHRYYAPNNAILVVAGDVDPADIEALAIKHYGELEPSDGITSRVRPTEPPHLAPRRLEFHDERVSNPYIIRSYLAPERNTGAQSQSAALTVLAELLGGSGLTSVLGKALQLEDPIAVSSGAFYSATSLDPDSFGVYVVPAIGVSLQDAEAKMDKVLTQFLIDGPDPAQMERIKAQIRASEIYALDNQNGLARRYGAALSIGLSVEDIGNWPNEINAVTADDVLAAAKDVLVLDNSVTGWLMKEIAE
ncbi:peptidase M16 [Rhodobacterales bacterium 52_120_T64]|nr:peptidase M16 [Rhodobacterales bacterium 52_120_T64]